MENIGTNFKNLRQKRNLTVEEVSEQTKIRKHLIVAIESGNFQVMPPVYLSYFIKTYGKFLKMPQSEIDTIIASMPGVEQKPVTVPPQPNDKKAEKKTPPPVIITTVKDDINAKALDIRKQTSVLTRKKPGFFSQANMVTYLIYTALALAIVSLVYFTFFSDGSNNLSSFETESRFASDTMVVGTASNESNNDFHTDLPDSIILEARGLDTAWLRIVVDGNESEQLVFYPELERKWAAKNYITLSVGNGGAIEFKRNGQLLKPFGTKGSVVRNVKITATEINISSSPWHSSKDSTVKRAARKRSTKKTLADERPRLLEPSTIQQTYTPFEKKEPR